MSATSCTKLEELALAAASDGASEQDDVDNDDDVQSVPKGRVVDGTWAAPAHIGTDDVEYIY